MDLNKALRAMHHSETWRNSVQAAAMFAGTEFTPQLLADMTKAHLDDLVLDETTQEVSVPKTIGTALVEAVEEWVPQEAEPSDLETRLATIEQNITKIRGEIKFQQAPPKEDPTEPGPSLGGRN